MFAIAWMVIGTTLYSYLIGTLTNVIERLDADRELLNGKIAVLKEFKSRTNLSRHLY